MKENFVSINAIVDESGSMGHLTSDTLGGFNKFLTEQKAFPGEAVFTLCTFNDKHSLVHDFKKIAEVSGLNDTTYRPGGGTALLDALGDTIEKVGAKLAAMPEEERPSKVIFLVITDGQENSSRRYTKAKVAEMVSHQRDVYKWEFVFLGANLDAVSEGHALGVATTNSVNYTANPAGTRAMYQGVSDSMNLYRSRSSNGPTMDFFTQEQKEALEKVKNSIISPDVVDPNKVK